MNRLTASLLMMGMRLAVYGCDSNDRPSVHEESLDMAPNDSSLSSMIDMGAEESSAAKDAMIPPKRSVMSMAVRARDW